MEINDVIKVSFGIVNYKKPWSVLGNVHGIQAQTWHEGTVNIPLVEYR